MKKLSALTLLLMLLSTLFSQWSFAASLSAAEVMEDDCPHHQMQMARPQAEKAAEHDCCPPDNVEDEGCQCNHFSPTMPTAAFSREVKLPDETKTLQPIQNNPSTLNAFPSKLIRPPNLIV